MDQRSIEAWLLLVVPTVIGLALPRVVRRPLSLIAVVIFFISLRGQGVHDEHFIAYVCNVMFLIGSLTRECVNFVVRAVRWPRQRNRQA